MKTDFFEKYPTMRDIAEYLKSKPDAANTTASKFIRDNLPKESDFQAAIIKAVKQWVAERRLSPTTFIWKHGAGVYNRNGLPDLMMLCDGRFFALEVKRPYMGKPTFLQEKSIDDINDAGGHAAVVSYPSEVKALLIQAGVWRDGA